MYDPIGPSAKANVCTFFHPCAGANTSSEMAASSVDSLDIRKAFGRRYAVTIKRFKESKRLSQAVVHNGVVYLTGQVADDDSAGIQEQTKQVLKKIDGLLDLCSTNKTNLLAVQIWLSDIRYFDEMNQIWEEWIAPHAPPSRATVESRLARPGLKVEMRATAAVE